MNKTYRFFSFLLSLAFIDLISSCCNCPETKWSSYTNADIVIQLIDYSKTDPIYGVKDTLFASSAGIRVRLRKEKIARLNCPPSILFGSLHAFSCGCEPDPLFKPKDSLVSFKIITEYDMNDKYKAGAIVNEAFMVGKPPFSDYMTIEAHLKNRQARNTLSNYDFIKDYEDFDIYLKDKIYKNVSFRINVIMELSDGRVLSRKVEGYFI